MKAVDSFSSASNIGDLKEQSDKIHEIVNEGLNENSIIGHLQNKVDEVIRAKEELCSVKAELKMQKESNQLLEAEFSFIKEEYEKQIQSLKENSERLEAALIEAQNKPAQTINVEAILTKEREKYEKKTKELELQIKELSSEKSSISEQNSSEISRISASLQSKIDRRNSKIEELVSVIKENQKQINDKEQQISKMDAELKEKDTEISKLKKKSASSNEPNAVIIEKLRNRLLRAKGKIEDLKKVEKQNLKFNELVNHYDTEREIMCDILHANDADGRKEWTDLRNKARNAAKAVTELAQAKVKLQSMEESLNEARESIKDTNKLENQLSKSNEKVDSLMKIREQLSNAIIENNALKSQVGASEKFIASQDIRSSIATILSKAQNDMNKEITGLHKALFNSCTSSFRPILLMVVFVTRWKRIVKNHIPDSVDVMSLLALTSSSGYSFQQKIKEINSEFIRLTKDLAETKEKLCKSEEKRVELKNMILDQQKGFEEGHMMLKREKEISAALKTRMSNLQRELSLLIPSHKFEEMKTKYTELEIENERLKEEVARLEELTGDQASAVNELRTKLLEAEASSHYSGKKMERMKDLAEKKEREADLLDARLREKTRDMLALERFAVQSDVNPFKRGIDRSQMQSAPVINQKFVGV